MSEAWRFYAATSDLPDHVVGEPFEFEAGLFFGKLPHWPLSDEQLPLSWWDRKRILGGNVGFYREYEADEVVGETQDDLEHAACLAAFALWLVRPSPLCVHGFVHLSGTGAAVGYGARVRCQGSSHGFGEDCSAASALL